MYYGCVIILQNNIHDKGVSVAILSYQQQQLANIFINSFNSFINISAIDITTIHIHLINNLFSFLFLQVRNI